MNPPVPQQPVTHHDIVDTVEKLIKTVFDNKIELDNKILSLNRKIVFYDERLNEEMDGTHKLLNSNDQENKSNFRAIDIVLDSLIQKDKDTKSRQENLDKKIERIAFYDNTRANNLEMKLRKKGYLSKKHAIDNVQYIRLPDKYKTAARTSTTIANKYTVL